MHAAIEKNRTEACRLNHQMWGYYDNAPNSKYDDPADPYPKKPGAEWACNTVGRVQATYDIVGNPMFNAEPPVASEVKSERCAQVDRLVEGVQQFLHGWLRRQRRGPPSACR